MNIKIKHRSIIVIFIVVLFPSTPTRKFTFTLGEKKNASENGCADKSTWNGKRDRNEMSACLHSHERTQQSTISLLFLLFALIVVHLVFGRSSLATIRCLLFLCTLPASFSIFCLFSSSSPSFPSASLAVHYAFSSVCVSLAAFRHCDDATSV